MTDRSPPMLFVLAVLSVLLESGVGQDANWGKKVKCFVIQGTVVCPGCNFRAGLNCPRRPEDRPEFESCVPSPPDNTPTSAPTTPAGPACAEETNTVDETSSPNPMQTEANTSPSGGLMQTEASTLPSKGPQLYLYRYLGPKRVRREEPEICRWHGDCPCPLICCKQGLGCPKRCIQGIKIHPHTNYGR